jgi:RNA polymerase sigma-70 factor (ECF subfamily)
MRSHSTDEELVAIFCAERQTPQGQDAFAELTQRYEQGLIEATTKQLRGDRHGAEDVVQQTFIQVFNNIDRFDPSKSSFLTWLVWIKHNCFTDEYRRRRRKKLVTNFMGDDIELSVLGLTSREPPPETQAIQADFLVRFWNFVDTLDTKRKQAFCLCVVEGLSQRQAAKIAHEHLTSISRRVLSASAALRETVGDIPDDLRMKLDRRKSPRLGHVDPIRLFIETLPPVEFMICDMLCCQGSGIDDAADSIGIPEPMVSSIFKGILDRLVCADLANA